MKHNNNGDYRIEVTVRNSDFAQIDHVNFSGRNAILDAIVYLDKKYDPPAWEIIKRYI